MHKMLGFCKRCMCIWSSTIKSSNNGLVVCPFHYLLFWTPYLTLYAHVSLAQKKISNTKHLLTFHAKREVTRTNIIALTLLLGMTIKSQIHSIHTTKGRTTILHCKKFKKILPSYSLGRTWIFLYFKLFKVQFCKLSCGIKFWQGKQRRE